MEELDLTDVVNSLRATFEDAMAVGENQELQFETTSIQIEFQVGVTKGGDGGAKFRFWVIELGGKTSYSTETIQKVTLSLMPSLKNGRKVKINQSSDQNPMDRT